MAGQELDRDMLDDAARAGWLYYVGGRTQDEIAKTMGISRQRAQRLVSRSVADGLIRVRIEHPIASLMELGQALKKKYDLKRVRVAPDIGIDGNLASVAPFAARMIEEVLWSNEPMTIGLGTGRALRASVEQIPAMNGAHHRLVSLISIIAPNGTANFYDAIMKLAELTKAPHYPLPIPAMAESEQECTAYQNLTIYKNVSKIAHAAEYVFVGIGQIDKTAPILLDGFVSEEERQELIKFGAVGEIAGRAFNEQGEYIDSQYARRTTSIQVRASSHQMVVAIASGKSKIASIKAALKGKLINALITDEPSAKALLR